MSGYDGTLNAAGASEDEKKAQGDAGVEPSGVKGDNPSTAGPGATKVGTPTPEEKEGHINPSAPEDSNVTPGSAGVK